MSTGLPAQGHVLVVEDEPRLAAVLGDYLAAAGYTHHWVADGNAALPAFHAQRPDLVLLDLMLPGRDGVEICRDLRRIGTVPVIMVTARVEEVDRLLGLEIGADDYVCKPFSPREVVARVGAVLRRHRAANARPSAAPLPAQAALLVVDAAGRASVRGRELDLTPVEFRLLAVLHGALGRAFSRDQLLGRIYDDRRVVTDRTIDSHIKNLRRKLAEAGGSEDWIKSIYSVGYRMEL
ncbi:two-component system response regulator [Variovorax paradoxus]|jgi:two-component system response regulator BaeR|uniref:response regulator n=1 Tax=Variovorax TaxID=34072 RepID=UPI0006E5E47B|nr:two-component system response regulator [Variovorax paradoxus]KPU91262.1 two-component system response regulator [Variovorax paradoxus]KPV06573.1 two-component system response regulator [Variovorax paradoxus]KPV14231.1 two-component system response regulator [Variovorax paradoxus]KPV15157.1 two-component system response regulator [Variovorax paradoxus]